MKKLITVLLLLIPLCCLAASRQYLESDIYFGLARDDGVKVTASQFNHFKKTAILPYFKAGFTTEKVQNTWFSKKVGMINTPSRVATIIYQRSKRNNDAIRTIVSAYKQQFRQAPVLVVTRPVRANFY